MDSTLGSAKYNVLLINGLVETQVIHLHDEFEDG